MPMNMKQWWKATDRRKPKVLGEKCASAQICLTWDLAACVMSQLFEKMIFNSP